MNSFSHALPRLSVFYLVTGQALAENCCPKNELPYQENVVSFGNYLVADVTWWPGAVDIGSSIQKIFDAFLIIQHYHRRRSKFQAEDWPILLGLGTANPFRVDSRQ